VTSVKIFESNSQMRFFRVRRLCENVTQLLLAGDTDTLTPLLVHPEATSSIMFAHTSPSVSYTNIQIPVFFQLY
jgi:hypothetical protein